MTNEEEMEQIVDIIKCFLILHVDDICQKAFPDQTEKERNDIKETLKDILWCEHCVKKGE